MADEGRNRFAFDNISVQAQGASKLLAAIKDKLKDGKLLDEKVAHEIPEIHLLWDYCTSLASAVSSACCQCWLQLVREGHAQFNYVLTGLLNVIPAASNASSAVQAITSLLLLQVTYIKKHSQHYTCPYGLRKSPHPFISILVSQPNASSLLVDQVSLLLEHQQHRGCDGHSVYKMLEPFLHFVLVDPRPSADPALQIQIQRTLLDAAENALIKEDDDSKQLALIIIDMLVFIQSYLQVDALHIGQTTYFAQQLAKWMMQHADFMSSKVDLVQNVAFSLLSLCHERLRLGMDILSSLVVLSKLQQKSPLVLKNATALWSLAALLMESPAIYSEHICNIWLIIISWMPITELTVHERVAAISIFPAILRLLSTPGQFLPDKPLVATQAMKLVDEILRIPPPDINDEQEPQQSEIFPSPWLRCLESCSILACKLFSNVDACIHWLKCVKAAFSTHKSCPSHLTLLLSAMLLDTPAVVLQEVLSVFGDLVQSVPSQSPNLLPLLLYKLGKEANPDLKLQILYTIPELATHKLSVAPVLRSVQTLSLSPALRSVALRLVCRVWMKQNRVFPHLHKALLGAKAGITDKGLLMEVNVSVAATIRDICKHRASQHGGDMLGILSNLINEHTGKMAGDEKSAVVIVLSLQGIKALCEAEVVDLCTVWRVLAPKLSDDRRPAVMKCLCELFALVPRLATDTQQYQEFKQEVLGFLWRMTRYRTAWVSGAAFSALANFSAEDFELQHLPDEVALPIKDRLRASRKPQENENSQEVEKSLDSSTPPGHAYIALLHRLSLATLTDFKVFLTALVREEALSIPRGVIHSASRASRSYDRVLSGIPSFLQTQYEKSKTPGLNQGLAAGLLFSYEPPFEEHSGKRARRYFLNCARSYRNMLDSLVHEVPVQPSEWHRNMLLPHAWTVFMIRLYSACVEGRKAELQMQYSHGHITDQSELRDKLNNVGLWVRDQVTEQLKTASRGSPSVQGNSVLSLAGLAYAVYSHSFQNTLEMQPDLNDESVNEAQAPCAKEWLLMVADTLMTVLDGNYKPRGSTLVWCQQVSSASSTASSLLARASAALSLSQLVPVLVALDPDHVKQYIDALRLRLPGQTKAGSSAVIQVHCGLGLGLLLSKLYQEHYSDVAGQDGYMLVTTALDTLENAGFSTDLENTEGACLGMGVALSSLCHENIIDSRVHLNTIHQKLQGVLDEHLGDPDQRLQTLCFNFALVTASLFEVGLISIEESLKCVNTLQELTLKHDQASGVSLALGLLLHELTVAGHSGVTETVTQHLSIWRGWVDNKELPSLKKLAGANGLMGLLGSERGFFQIDTALTPDQYGQGACASILKLMQARVSSPQDIGLASNIAWLLGHVYAASTSTNVTRTSVPDSYTYLPESSVLRASFDFLANAGKTVPGVTVSSPGVTVSSPSVTDPGVTVSCPGVTVSSAAVDVVLESLLTGPTVGLPPVNWPAVLGPLMRSSESGLSTCRLCVQFAIVQAKSSSSLPPFISSWLSAGFDSLDDELKVELFQSLSKLAGVVPPTRMQEFIRGPAIREFNPSKESVCLAILRGVLSVMTMKDPPPSAIGWTSTTLRCLYEKYTPDMSEDTADLFALCLAEMQPEDVDKLTQGDSLKSIAVRCRLVGSGRAKLNWMNVCLSTIMSSVAQDSCELDLAVYHVTRALSQSPSSKADERLQWLMELTSHIRSSACESIVQPSSQALSRGLAVLSSACAHWASGVQFPDLHMVSRAQQPSSLRRHYALLCMLPGNLLELLNSEPWARVASKMFDWLFALRDAPAVKGNDKLRSLVKDCIVNLRHNDAFKKADVWTESVKTTT
ncbi:focadhesin [Nematostella vectensis]|uniref:focadhesin n=1 Tax=Nematostella vectensis TaxID=45351 RepID=UPI002076E847|nr:focadhesin [Nematostella vectensis]